MKILQALILVLTTSLCGKAQFIKNSALSFDALGPGVFNSINYEQQLTGASYAGLRLQAGAGFGAVRNQETGDKESILSIPLELSYLIQLGEIDYLEVGGGYTIMRGMDEQTIVKTIELTDERFPFAELGYRMVSRDDHGLFGVVSFTPLLANKFIPYGSLGFGYQFR